jgi:hypothetical protein
MITVCHLIAALARVADSRKEKNSLVGRANGGFLFKPIYNKQLTVMVAVAAAV